MQCWLVMIVWLLPGVAPDPRFISYQDLMETADGFSEPGVTSYSQLLFDIARNQVIVGARDTILRLSLDCRTKLEKAVWPAPPDKTHMCQTKGQPEQDCHNFVKVLLTNGRKLFTCGTNAFSPQCAWREMEEVSRVTEWVTGVGKSPYNPHSNITALLTRENQYFTGSPLDFPGVDAAITRAEPYLRTTQQNSKWLNEPQFVGSFETEQFVYFMFRETAVEYINCGKIIYSRIARVCKNDSGGQFMLKENWTTYVKARLNCSLPGEYPFYFDNIQGMTYLADQGLIYATFTTPTNSIPGSAICSFNMSAVLAAFNGAFKHQATPKSTWERQVSTHATGHCSNSYHILESSTYQLMDQAVQPTTITPIYHNHLETLSHIAVDIVPTKLHRAVHILYVATIEGLIKKLSVVGRTGQSCTLEIWQPSSTPTAIHTIKFVMDSLYVGMETGVLRIPREHCARHKSRASCINSMDPHCGWDDHGEACTTATDPLAPQFHQDATQCPLLHLPVDGGWSAWSSWARCINSESEDVSCLCSTRTCDNPAPERGGSPCPGHSVRVSNCTVHGAWSPWSGWSACSQSCGMAVKTRRRVCGNPAPQHGGRTCVGLDRQEMYCHSNPPCPTMPREGGSWGSWGAWGECSAKCGGGYRMRSRTCVPPGHNDCSGCNIDYQRCNTATCLDSKRVSNWSSWMPAGNGTERRVKFSCRAPSPDPALIKISMFKQEERYCTPDGVCTRTERGEGWSEWSSWSPCNVDCGEGLQHRSRTCEASAEDCHGPHTISKPCQAQPCHGEWGCWSDWGECSVSCGSGARERRRLCLFPQGSPAHDCPGPHLSHQPCEQPPCNSAEGWDNWSGWSACSESGEQSRSRLCLASSPGPDMCQGSDRESRVCGQDDDDSTSMTVGAAVWSGMVAFVVGVLVGGGGMAWRSRRRSSIPSSPHYISKQNPYVSVPLRDLPRDTLKRNSHANGHLRADLEQDKFF